MFKLKYHLVLAGLIGCSAASVSFAASSTASLAADSASTSVGSVSDSFKGSSNSSTTKTAAAGDYKVVEMVLAADRPGMVRLQLQAVLDQSADGEVFLFVPLAVSEQARLSQGDVITARARSYGTEFSDARTKTAFFLVLDDQAYRDLRTQAVAL
jgi:hypothetical protein